MSARLDAMLDARRRADAVKALRGLRTAAAPATAPSPGARPGEGADATPGEERCDLCGTSLPADHRHLLHLTERWIMCSCEACWAMRSGDPDLRPAGMRTLWLDDFRLPDELWAAFGVPVGLAFFLRSGAAGRVVAMYPSPAGATECELEFADWEKLAALNPILDHLEADGEALIVNRMATPHQHAIAPIDQCYRLVGMIKANWEGISGGDALEKAVPAFFAELKEKAA